MRNPPSGLALVLTFALLVVLAAGSWIAVAFHVPTAVTLAIAGVKALAIGYVFMELGRAQATDKIMAVIAVLFVILLCVGSVADVAFR
jgi:hypothetical protein